MASCPLHSLTIIGGNRAQIPSSLASRLFWGINILIYRGTLISNHQVDRLTRKFSLDSGKKNVSKLMRSELGFKVVKVSSFEHRI